ADDVGGGAHIRSIGIDTGMLVQDSILAFGEGGSSVACYPNLETIHPICCDVFGNEGGDWVNCLRFFDGEDGNISEDPLFCDWPGGDYTLSAESPCADGNANDRCGLIGAYDVGCGPTPVEGTSWGEIKSFTRGAV